MHAWFILHNPSIFADRKIHGSLGKSFRWRAQAVVKHSWVIPETLYYIHCLIVMFHWITWTFVDSHGKACFLPCMHSECCNSAHLPDCIFLLKWPNTFQLANNTSLNVENKSHSLFASYITNKATCRTTEFDRQSRCSTFESNTLLLSANVLLAKPD